ncbi:hypothetical protein EDB83DRAFT_2534913 [Lactarius deliciosus]|nr:hypothetical protein EDB83DRAFT_2534913 [Lactarius deliciosus]
METNAWWASLRGSTLLSLLSTLNSLTKFAYSTTLPQCLSEHKPTTTSDDLPVEPNLEYVKSEEFDQDEDSVWFNWNDNTSVSTVEPSPHEVPKGEANLYYAGLSPNGRGPKLIYRTSDDKFIEAEGPRAYKRLMRLCPVPEDHELGQDGRWDCIRDQVVELLDEGGIKLTSVDLVQFTWLDEMDDQEIQEEEDDDDDDAQNDNLTYDDIPLIKPIEYGKRHTTNPTIWVGVLPDTLTGMVAHESATEILGLLKELGIAGVDVAYRESVAKFLHATGLFAPASDLNPLKNVIDNLSTPLSLPIAGRKTPMQGTLCCYFRVGNNLYATTAPHNMFPLSGDNKEYNYVDGGCHLSSWETPRSPSTSLRSRPISRVEAGGDNAQMLAGELVETRDQLTKTVTKIKTLKAFFVDIKSPSGAKSPHGNGRSRPQSDEWEKSPGRGPEDDDYDPQRENEVRAATAVLERLLGAWEYETDHVQMARAVSSYAPQPSTRYQEPWE